VTNSAGNPQPGWYPDVSHPNQVRWWDGAQWTTHVHDASGNVTATAYTPAVRLVAPEGTVVNTVWVWILACLPVLTLIGPIQLNVGDYIRRIIASTYDSATGYGDPSAMMAAIYSPGYAIAVGLSFLLFAVSVVLSYFDWRQLRRAGVPSPFHWAWSFLSNGVYMIGRSVVVKRRSGGGLTPLWLWIVVIVITTIVVFIIVISSLASALPTIDQYGQYGGLSS
jgi:hypothetical protein